MEDTTRLIVENGIYFGYWSISKVADMIHIQYVWKRDLGRLTTKSFSIHEIDAVIKEIEDFLLIYSFKDNTPCQIKSKYFNFSIRYDGKYIAVDGVGTVREDDMWQLIYDLSDIKTHPVDLKAF